VIDRDVQLNPFARVETIRGAANAIGGIRIVAPVKGRGLQTTLILRSDDSDGFGPRRRAVLSALFDAQTGIDPWSRLSEVDRGFLERAGLFLTDTEMPGEVVVDAGVVAAREIDAGQLARLRHDLRTHRTALQPRIVTGTALGEMQRYYRALVEEGYAQYGGEGGEPHRWVLHNDALSRAMHPSLAAPVSAIAGLALKPSFSYLIVYLEGAALERHTDRPQCAITAVLQVDFDPEPVPADGVAPWPLHFRRDGGVESMSLALGDLLVFRGTEVEHYREPLTSGHSSTSLAFCFVTEDFDGSLD
jgi:hypothetical protein